MKPAGADRVRELNEDGGKIGTLWDVNELFHQALAWQHPQGRRPPFHL
jgi:hypothetical protein